jgi:hypothetical protein
MLLKVSFNTKKTVHQAMRYSQHIVVTSFIGVNAIVNNISAMTYNMAVSFIGV